MTAHDTWVQLKEGHPFEDIEHLFPDGFPMRDPFPMGVTRSDTIVNLWFMDMNRLDNQQKHEIASLMAKKFGVDPQKIIDESPEGFAINHEWIESMEGGVENYRRTLELADFNETEEPDSEAYKQFIDQQYRDWIDGDRVPEPMPENYEDIDPRMRSPELEQAYKRMEVQKLLNEGNYSTFDILSGKPWLTL